MRKNRLRQQAEPIAEACIAVRVRLLNRIITNIYDTAMRPYGISLNQASILTLITMSDSVGHGDIGRILFMEKSTVSRNIERMKKKDWITTDSSENTGAAVIAITPRGEEILEKAYASWAEAQEEAIRRLGSDGVDTLMKLADRFWPIGFGQAG
ncbi:MAG: hypothetical protein A2520_04770 [Deltaproteobacteria bacterium RIFOXYD12_FULL_53_23]|nr:MAG: hypothetical protein A2520_04770 [Deltaproteobacteria bacterium RIFOXYD12_FULL_53_23]